MNLFHYHSNPSELLGWGTPVADTGAFGTQWYLNGIEHREDGPAWIHKNGLLMWYYHGDPYASFYPSSYDEHWQRRDGLPEGDVLVLMDLDFYKDSMSEDLFDAQIKKQRALIARYPGVPIWLETETSNPWRATKRDLIERGLKD